MEGPFSAQLSSSGRSGRGAISMPSSINASGFIAGGLSDDAARLGFAMVDLARLIRETFADILGASAHRLNHFPELAHHLAFLRIHRQRPCGGLRETADTAVPSALCRCMRTTDRARNQVTFACVVKSALEENHASNSWSLSQCRLNEITPLALPLRLSAPVSMIFARIPEIGNLAAGRFHLVKRTVSRR
jgi:hypothetical protein